MKWNHFVPRKQGQAVVWLENFNSKFVDYAVGLRMSPERVASIKSSVTGVIDNYREMYAAITYCASCRKAFQQNFKILISGQGGLNDFIAEIKSQPGYHAGIGADLGIVGHAIEVDYVNHQPDLKAVRGRDEVAIHFKIHYAQAAAIYSRRGGEENFTLLGISHKSPFYDKRTNIQEGVPEMRNYRIVLMENDMQVSKLSNIVEVKME